MFYFVRCGIVDETCLPVMFAFRGRLVEPHLVWVQVCLSGRSYCIFFLCRLYDFPKYDFLYVDRRLVVLLLFMFSIVVTL